MAMDAAALGSAILAAMLTANASDLPAVANPYPGSLSDGDWAAFRADTIAKQAAYLRKLATPIAEAVIAHLKARAVVTTDVGGTPYTGTIT